MGRAQEPGALGVYLQSRALPRGVATERLYSLDYRASIDWPVTEPKPEGWLTYTQLTKAMDHLTKSKVHEAGGARVYFKLFSPRSGTKGNRRRFRI